VNGFLCIDVSLQTKSSIKLFNPYTVLDNMLALNENNTKADVRFELEGAIMKACLQVLAANAPILAELYNDHYSNSFAHIPTLFLPGANLHQVSRIPCRPGTKCYLVQICSIPTVALRVTVGNFNMELV
jgi:hypothetical protein